MKKSHFIAGLGSVARLAPIHWENQYPALNHVGAWYLGANPEWSGGDGFYSNSMDSYVEFTVPVGYTKLVMSCGNVSYGGTVTIYINGAIVRDDVAQRVVGGPSSTVFATFTNLPTGAVIRVAPKTVRALSDAYDFYQN